MMTMIVQTIKKAGLDKMPLKMFNSSLIFLEQIILKICMKTNRLKTTVKCREGVILSNALYIGLCSVS